MTYRRPLRTFCVLFLCAAMTPLLPVHLQPASRAAMVDAPDWSARRDAGSLGGDGAVRFEVVNHNVEMRQSAVSDALRRASRSRAEVILLQEVCWWQLDDIRATHPKWSVGWVRGVDDERCRRSPGLTLLGEGDRADSGQVAIWTGGAHGRVTARLFRAQGLRKQHQAGERSLRDGVVCVHWKAAALVRRACSTHLVNASRFRDRRGVQFRQARELRKITRPWIKRGDLVVLGGDFNARPLSRPLDFIYAARGGDGRFQEATRCPRTVETCRRALGTTWDGGKVKIDYIFFSANRVVTTAPRKLRIIRTASDHHLLSGWAWLDLR